MGINIRVWIKREELKKLDLLDAIAIYRHFNCRWQYGITDRFVFEESPSILSVKDIIKHVTFNSDVSQHSRNILEAISDLDLLFQMDCEDDEPKGYVEFFWFFEKCWEKGLKELKEDGR